MLGSQGDAGQFRTPRHIIDFMVEVMDPKKNETILDPACGTAGFLISAWKHILKANTSEKGQSAGRAGDLLTPEERARLAASIHGYDISPDMVRLSLVNLYLHGFTDPRIEEYDTLTSDDKWNEVADVILANPPFMSPKGGIKPHKRFTVAATRSEVLFVDYMAEHLTATGRAAIVVPEGIIFQSGTAYKALRKLLVNTSLVAVVSLPAGVFNPYSGVKTSILILDKRLHKQLDSVLFVKVGNDGFNLGAQRRAVVNSDLPEATRLLKGWMTAPEKFEGDGVMAQAVERTRLAENADFNLSGERYLIGTAAPHSWRIATLGELCTKITDGSHNPPEKQDSGELMLSSQNIFDNELNLNSPRLITAEDFERENKRTEVAPGDVLLTIVGTIGRCLTVNEQMPKFALQRSVAVFKPKSEELSPDYLCRIIQSGRIQAVLAATAKGVAQKGVYLGDLRALEIPLPPLEVQNQIVAEIEGYQKIIGGARQVLDNYKPHIVVQPDWPIVQLGTLVSTSSGGTPSKSDPELWIGTIPWVSPKDMKVDFLEDTEDHISELAVSQSATKLVDADTLLCVVRSGILQHTFPVALTRRAMCFNQDIVAIRPISSDLDVRYLFYTFKSGNEEILKTGIKPGVTVQSFHSGFFKSYPLPLPDLPTQRAIVAEIEAEQALVNANRELIRRMEAKVKAAIDRVWGA